MIIVGDYTKLMTHPVDFGSWAYERLSEREVQEDAIHKPMSQDKPVTQLELIARNFGGKIN